MKHYYSFLIITSLLLAGCGQKDRAKSQFESSVQTEESYPLAKEYIKEAVITGKVLNRDFYPQERELTLIIPFFWKMENQYRTPIQEDGSFSFRFREEYKVNGRGHHEADILRYTRRELRLSD